MTNDQSQMTNKHRVLLGMSGGIDSTVSAMLLLEQGYEVVGVTFRTYDSMKDSCIAKEKGCCTIDSIMEAKHNAERMGFEHHIVDFRETFKRCVIQNFIDEYMAGRTPNPCVLCNATIKWGEMLHLADELGCDYTYLRTAADTKKDQTYFLWMLTEEQLQRTIFPLGDYTKEQVREIARQHGYEQLAVKRESQEICFIPDDDYRTFLRANVPDYNERVHAGEYIDANGKVLGHHEGYVNYTIGQRKGLGIALGHPVYITHIDAATNRITLGTNDDMYATELSYRPVGRPIAPASCSEASSPLTAKVRYRSQAVPIKKIDGNCISFATPVWGVTPGQSVVLYSNDIVIGGGIIL